MQMIKSQTRLVTTLLLLMLTSPPCANSFGKDEKVQSFTSDYASVNGLKMYYEIHGNPAEEKPPLVLLHGGGSTIETTFGIVLPLLAKNRQVVAFDQQGHGRTADIADRPFSFEQSADDAVGLLNHLNVEKADFFGFSNGGNIALQIAVRHPSRVRKLVVASAMFKRDGLYPEVWEFMKRSTLEHMPQALQEAYRKVSPHPEKLKSFHDKSAKRMLEFTDWQPEVMQSIDAPTLFMIGDADSVRPEHAVEMFRLPPHANLAVLPGGHGAYIGELSAAKLQDSRVQFGDPTSSANNNSKLPEFVVAMIAAFLDAPLPEPKIRESKTSPRKPEDWPRLFEQYLNAGDLEALVALYEPDAGFVSPTGETIVGSDRIREVLAGMIDTKTHLQSRVVNAVTVNDIATLYTDFQGTKYDASGKTIEIRQKAIEVLRRQPNGTWKLIVGDPNGRR